MPLKRHTDDKKGFSIEAKEKKLREGRYFLDILHEVWNKNIMEWFCRAELFWNQSLFWEKSRLALRA